MNSHALVTTMIGALVVFSLYRRFRRNFGRQPMQPKRMKFRVVLLAVVSLALLLSSSRDVHLLAAGVMGLTLGAALAVLGLRLTRFEVTEAGSFYTPNAYIGVGLTSLFVGRLLYRFVSLAPALHAAAGDAANPNPFGNIQRSPLTLAIVLALIGYYAVYFAGILVRERKLIAAKS